MWPLNRGRKSLEDSEKIAESVAYDEISKNEKYSDIVMVYDEAEILLFHKPRRRIKTIKKT